LLTKNNPRQLEEVETVNIIDEINSRVDSMRKIHPDYNFAVEHSDESIPFKINNHHLEQLLLIFLDNAVKYDTEYKYIITKTEKYNEYFDIIIMDDGIGIPEEDRSEEHTSELQSRFDLVCRLLLEKRKSC